MASHRAIDAANSSWTEREAELLAITLQLLREQGYDGLTVEAVAVRANASKSTVYKRWPSKADLVLAAFIESTRDTSKPPNAGSLREDLLILGRSARRQAQEHSATVRAVLNVMSQSPALTAAMQEQFIRPRQAVVDAVLQAAAERGEISTTALNTEISDLLPGYLVFRTLVTDRPPTDETVRILVDEVLLPILTGRSAG
ncbi:TetR/AcrR family transcriptional regulator (plasmid) [Mycolicibacterium psychrotolerans]|uniref:TetR/AcrR family transcriptional regulator n=1 Tax=Mycolicibacterium psychrotolerans TaxID=216929 RepID=UPI003D667AE8